MLVIGTPLGTVVHTADFKLDPDPVDGVGLDLERLSALGRDGVLALLSDSTNADRPGRTPGERTVAAALERLVASARGRVVVTTFASHVHRLRQLAEIASRHGRKLALVGSSLERHAEIAEQLGLLPLPLGCRVPADEIRGLDPGRVLVVATGSQGEPASALARIAAGKHRQIELGEGDLVIHSARVIPGNGKSIGRLINLLMRGGAEVVTAAEAPVHVSGHASSDELAEILRRLRPDFLVPIHGEYRQLHAHARIATESGFDRAHIQLADPGDVISLSRREISVTDRVRVGPVFIDGGLDEVDLDVLRDRRRLAGDGIVVPVVALHRDTRAPNGPPEIMARGFVPMRDEENGALADEARRVVAASLAQATPEERADESLLRTRIQLELRRFLRRRTQRRPLVIPVILEL
jgi:ribonuclease J